MDSIETEPSLFASLWRFKWYIVAAAVLAAAVGYGVSMMQPTVYEAQGELLLNDPRTSGGVAEEIGIVLDPNRYVRNQAQVVESPQVATRASENLGGTPTPRQIQDSVSATPARDLDVLTVHGSRPTADGAVAVVDAVVQAYEEIVEEGITSKVNDSIATLEQSKAEIQAKIAEIDAELADDPGNVSLEAQRTAAIAQLVADDTRIEQLATNAALYGSGVQLYVAPETPGSPAQPKPLRNAAIAMVLGVIAAGAWAWWRSEQDQRADHRNIPAGILDAPLLAVVPEFGDVGATAPNPTVTNPGSGAAEAYHFAVSSLGFALEQTNGKSVVITSAAPGDGKSATALNVAIASAQDGRKPLLIDADERARGLTRLAGLNGEPGITDLGNGTPVTDVVTEWAIADNTTLPFVPAGSELDGSTAGYFRSAPFREALPALASKRDLVIIDAPPVMSAAETTDLAAQADGVVVVVRYNTPLRDLADTRQRLAMSGTPILGYVFNRAKTKTHGYGYGYGYGKDTD
ncbi:MAG: AAA family ATPase [Actinomycetota bacterium]|nr:AAA family ATPase [Actinomycetota bacterium]